MSSNLLRVFFCLLFIPFLIASGPSTTSYKPLADINLYHYNKANLFVSLGEDYFTLTLNSWSQRKSAPELASLNEEVINATHNVFYFARTKGLPIRECRSNSTLEIFLVNFDVLNDSSRFNQWKKSAPNAVAVRALYSPRPELIGTSAIVLTPQGDENSIIIGHEISHYWFDRFCWERVWKENSTEGFARQFEAFYRTTR